MLLLPALMSSGTPVYAVSNTQVKAPTGGLVPYGGLRPSGAVLTDAAASGDSKIYVTDHSVFRIGQWLELSNSEILEVTGRTDGVFTQVTQLAEPVDSVETVLDVDDSTVLNIGETILIVKFSGPTDISEQMLIIGKTGDGPGGATDTITVIRGRASTPIGDHFDNDPVLSGRVRRCPSSARSRARPRRPTQRTRPYSRRSRV
jgi:hypothetical protein